MAEKIKSIPLPFYTQKEERFNALSHECGFYMSLVWLSVIMLKCLFTGASTAKTAACALFCITVLLLFFNSAFYHWFERGNSKRFLRLLDHCWVNFAMGGVFTPYFMLDIYAKSPVKAVLLLKILWGTIALLTILNLLDMEGCKHLLYGLSGILAVFMMYQVICRNDFFTREVFAFAAAGGFLISTGSILFFLGSKRRWLHSAFHVVVILGCTMFYCSLYFMI